MAFLCLFTSACGILTPQRLPVSYPADLLAPGAPLQKLPSNPDVYDLGMDDLKVRKMYNDLNTQHAALSKAVQEQ